MYRYEFPHPAVTTDVVIFTVRDTKLQVLLVCRAGEPYRGAWALPGGFVGPDESLDAAAARELEEETGVTGVCLEQLHAFGEPDRDPRERVITVAYFALVPPDRLRPRAADDAGAVGWFPMDDLPALAFDHAEIIAMAHKRLVLRTRSSPHLSRESFWRTSGSKGALET
jgi:8-oxo-dGTP diphosphatase